MKAILTCGHPYSGIEVVHEALVHCGLAAPKPPRLDSMPVAQFHDALFKSARIDPTALGVTRAVTPDRSWQEVAAAVFASNAQHDWGWSDPKAVWLLEFWHSMDPQVRFVLAYGAPEFALAGMLKGKEAQPDAVAQMLASWNRFNDEILRFYHRHADRCLLVNVAGIRQSPVVFIDRAIDKFGLKLRPTSRELTGTPAESSHVQAALARDLIEDLPQAAALYAELESAADVNAAEPSIARADRQKAWGEQVASQARLEGLQATAAALEVNAQGLSRENELQKLQVQQIQEELDGVFSNYQALLGCTAPAEVAIDLRQVVEGENWYDPEPDGRWGGPGVESTLKIPRMQDGEIEIQLDVVDAMEPEILRETRVSVNGVPVELRHDWLGYPALVSGRFATADLPKQETWEVRLKFPRLRSPAEAGLDDHRQLAIRVRAIRLRLLEEGERTLS